PPRPAVPALGRAQVENGELVTAKTTLTAAAASTDPAYATVVTQARRSLDALEPRIPRLELLLPERVQPKRVTIDGVAILKAGAKELDPGAHQIAVEVEGYRPVDMTVTLSEGERRSVQIALVPEPHGAAAPRTDASQ